MGRDREASSRHKRKRKAERDYSSDELKERKRRSNSDSPDTKFVPRFYISLATISFKKSLS